MGILDWFNRPPSPEKFAKLYAAWLARHGHAGPFRFVAAEFQFLVGSTDTRPLNLHNVYRDYCAAPKAERDNVLAKYAHILNVPEAPNDFASARGQLLPMLRSNAYLGTIARLARANGNPALEQASRPFSSDTAIMLAIDNEHTIQSVPAETLVKWGVTFDEAYGAALDNLRDISVAKFDTIAPGLVVGAWNDSYDTSRALLADVLHQAGVGAAPVFMLPTRNRLLVASGSNPAAVAQMVELAHKVVGDEGRPVSAKMYRLEDREAVEFVPDDAAIADNLRLLAMKFLSDDYAQQKAELEKIHEKERADVFVATYAIFEMDGRPVSIGTLSKDVDTLLPKTDAIAFMMLPEADAKPSFKLVRWEDAWPVLSGIAQRQHDYPERYRVSVFPPEDVLQGWPALNAAGPDAA